MHNHLVGRIIGLFNTKCLVDFIVWLFLNSQGLGGQTLLLTAKADRFDLAGNQHLAL